jgi:hypothetical protein
LPNPALPRCAVLALFGSTVEAHQDAPLLPRNWDSRWRTWPIKTDEFRKEALPAEFKIGGGREIGVTAKVPLKAR